MADRSRASIAWGIFLLGLGASLFSAVVAGTVLFVALSSGVGPTVEALLHRDLEDAVADAAQALDGDALANVLASGDAASSEYKALQAALVEVQKEHGLGTDVYTLHRRGERTQFGVSCKPTPLLGQPYLLKDEMRAVFAGQAPLASTSIYKDDHGIWISAYAGVTNAAGEVVGLVEADHDLMAYVGELRSRVARAFALSALAGLLLAALLSWVVSRRLTAPLVALAQAAEAISEGRVDEADVDTDAPGEIGQLASSFHRAIVATRYYIKRAQELEASRAAEDDDDDDLFAGVEAPPE